MNPCTECGSYAINQHAHGRKLFVDLDLCDVCYWRKRARGKDTIAQSIRSAALSWPLGFFGDVESRILDDAFLTHADMGYRLRYVEVGSMHWRTYALLVALALE